MFKARFAGWDDVLAVDYTLSADYVSKAAKQLGVTVRKGFYAVFSKNEFQNVKHFKRYYFAFNFLLAI